MEKKIIYYGNYYGSDRNSGCTGSVYGGGGYQAYHLLNRLEIGQRTCFKEMEIGVKQATKEGVIHLTIPGVCDLSQPSSRTRRGRVQGGGNVSPTITTSGLIVKIIKWREQLK